LKAYALDFKGIAKMASIKNFILTDDKEDEDFFKAKLV